MKNDDAGNPAVVKKEKTGKLFGVINILDLIIVIIIICAVIAGALYIKTGGFKSGKPIAIYYTVEVQGAEKGFHELISAGDQVKDSVKGYPLGTVQSVESQASKTWLINEQTREYVENVQDDLEVIYIDIECDGLETESSVTTGDVAIRVGEKMYIEGKGYACIGYVYGVRAEEK